MLIEALLDLTFRFWQVAFHIDNCSLGSRDRKSFPLKTGFHYARFTFKTDFAVYTSIKLRSLSLECFALSRSLATYHSVI